MVFKTFGEYMYSLLFAPLRKAKHVKNQWYLFFKVIGKLFDRAKQDIFLVREESMVITASEKMLEQHGLDRGMIRLKGESLESFRTRLAMRYIIASEAGTNQAIRYVAKAFGYENVSIAPSDNPEKWAEVSVQFVGGNIVLDDRDLLLKELNKIKPAGVLLSVVKEQVFPAEQYLGTAYIIGKLITIRQG